MAVYERDTRGCIENSILIVMKNRHFIISMIILTLCIQCVSAETLGSMFRSNPQHTGVYDDGGKRPENIKMWEFETGYQIASSPAVVNNVVYFGSYDGKVYALNAWSGEKIWEFNTGNYIHSSPAVQDGKVFIGHKPLYALSATTGEKIWEFTPDDIIWGDPVVSKGYVYIASMDPGTVYKIDANSGEKIWEFNSGAKPREEESVVSSPTIWETSAGTRVVFGTITGKIFVLDANTGKKLDVTDTEIFGPMTTIAMSDSIAYVGTLGWGGWETQPKVLAYPYMYSGGHEKWHFTQETGVSSSPAVANSVVYVADNGGVLHAFNAFQGSEIWRFSTSGPAAGQGQSSPAVANGVVYIGSCDGNVTALDAQSGQKLWAFKTGGAVESSPAVANGVVYVGSDDHKMYAIGRAYPLPTVNFTANPVSGYAPLTVFFNDTSSGSPTSWYWDFGDGSRSTIRNTSHVYRMRGTYNVSLSMRGTYNVSLTATNSYGSKKITKYSYVKVNLPYFIPPVANFTATPTSGIAPLTVLFNDTSTGSKPTSWYWQFGDGNVSLKRNDSHTFTNPGVYSVKLFVINRLGDNSTTKIIRVDSPIKPPDANFSGSPLSGTAPLTVHFHDLSSGSPSSWYWQFGDSGDSFMQDPNHIYMSPGFYTVSLIVGNEGGTDKETKNAYIHVNPPPTPGGGGVYLPPFASFTAIPRSGFAPLDVQFNDTSTGGTPSSWYWQFGDGGTSTAKSPVHRYYQRGNFTVNLTVGNKWGSTKKAQTGYINVTLPHFLPPVANFSGTPTSGYEPLLVIFKDFSTGSPTSWYWQFGDGATSTWRNVTHWYTRSGNYTVNLTVQNVVGNSKMTKKDYLVVIPPTPGGGGGQPIAARFNATPTSGSAPLSVQFNDYSSGSPTAWYWSFGDGEFSQQQNPAHTYGIGNYTVSLVVSNNGAQSTSVRAGYISVSSPPSPPFSGTVPTVSTITPNTGVSGTSVSISDLFGSHFQPGAIVKLIRNGQNDIGAMDSTVVSPNHITCTIPIPPGAAPGPWNVVVINPDKQSGILHNAFIISAPLPAPEVSAIMPNTGKAGTSVSITNLQGSNFRHGAGGTTVKLTRSGQGDILAKGVTVASSSQIICSIPIPSGAAPGQWNVVVINPGGKSGILPNGFTITQAL